MPKASPIQNNFNAGEVTPLLAGRTDIAKYRNALKVSLNGIPLVQGGWTRRPGMIFIGESKNHSEKAYLYPFEFSVEQAYMLAFGPSGIRVIRNNGLITFTPQAITAISATNPAVVTYVGADSYANGDRVAIASVSGMTQVNNREFTVANVNAGANTFELSGVNATGYDAYVSGGTVAEIFEIALGYAEADLFQLKFTQSADVLYITHPSYTPYKLTRTGHTSWTANQIQFQDGPYLIINPTTTTFTLSATSGIVTVTASAVAGINDGAGFVTTDPGRLIRWRDPANNWTWLRIITFLTTTTVLAEIIGPNASAGTATVNWRLGVWSETTGYPAVATFFEDRLFFGGPTSFPQRIDGSKSGDYENFAPTNPAGLVADDNAVSFTLNSNDVNVIRWMVDDEKGLLVGTVGGEWIVRPSVQAEALSPTNIVAKQSTTYGSANLPAIKAGKAALFVQRAGRKLRELAYVFEADGFRAPDMSVLAEHITNGGIVDLAYQKEPQSVLWLVRADGVLLSFTYEREQDVLGWGRHILGGAFGGGDTVVESVGCIPASDGSRDEVYVVVKRTVNGNTKRYIEYMDKIWDGETDQVDAKFIDSMLTYDGAPTTTITGLWHLEGQDVSVLVDGATHPNKTVTNGKIALDREGSVVHVGLGYNSDGQMLRIEAGAADGTAQGKLQRNHRVIVRVWETLGLRLGHEFSGTMYRPPMRSSADPTDAAVPLFTGDVEMQWEGGYSTENYVCWRFDQPLPGTIIAVMPQMHTQDR